MILPKRWGEGALFVFSALEGEAFFTDQMVGTLLADGTGICFSCKGEKWDLYAVTDKIIWDLVVCDQLTGHLQCSGAEDGAADGQIICSFGFYNAHTVIGRVPHGSLRICRNGNISRFPSGSGMWQSGELELEIYRVQETDYYRMTYGKNSCKVSGQVLSEQVLLLEENHRQFYEKLPHPPFPDPETEETFYKACSVMKAGFYSAEPPFRQRWTTPDKTPHQTMFLWDSVFHSFGNRIFGADAAKETILSVLDTEHTDGFIPHMSAPDHHSEVTQPPLLAWGVWRLYQQTGEKEWLISCYHRLCGYLDWNIRHRMSVHGLFQWHVNRTSIECRCDESGMDNNPRFDTDADLESIDFSCYMAHEAEMMTRIASVVKPQEAQRWQELREQLAVRIRERLWDETDGLFYDRILPDGPLRRVKSMASLLPLWAGICTEDQAEKLIGYLEDPAYFGTPMPVPSVAVSDPAYCKDMWRGPVWLNYDYMIIQGLRRYNRDTLADQLAARVLNEVIRLYMEEGILYEFYDDQAEQSPATLRRKRPLGFSGEEEEIPKVYPYVVIRDYGWTAAVFAALSMEKSGIIG